MRFLFDTAVFLYAVGAEHPYRSPCQELVRDVEAGTLVGEASVELVQEFAHVRLRRTGDRAEAAALAGHVAELCVLHDFERRDLATALDLVAAHDGVGSRDAVHAATALNRDIEAIVSPDRAFDAIPGLLRIDPADRPAIGFLTR